MDDLQNYPLRYTDDKEIPEYNIDNVEYADINELGGMDEYADLREAMSTEYTGMDGLDELGDPIDTTGQGNYDSAGNYVYTSSDPEMRNEQALVSSVGQTGTAADIPGMPLGIPGITGNSTDDSVDDAPVAKKKKRVTTKAPSAYQYNQNMSMPAKASNTLAIVGMITLTVAGGYLIYRQMSKKKKKV